MKQKSIKLMIAVIILILMTSCAAGKIVLSNNADIDRYKYVVFGDETSGDRELDDVILEVHNQIAETNLKVLSNSEISKVLVGPNVILTPNIHVTSEKWDGGHTYITVTFYDYNDHQCVAVVKSSGIGVTVSQDREIALGALKKKLDELFKK